MGAHRAGRDQASKVTPVALEAAAAASLRILTVFAHRNPHALHSVFGPFGPCNKRVNRVIDVEMEVKAYLAPFRRVCSSAGDAYVLFEPKRLLQL